MGFRRTDLMKFKALILKTCSACEDQALFSPADVLQYFGADREVSHCRSAVAAAGLVLS